LGDTVNNTFSTEAEFAEHAFRKLVMSMTVERFNAALADAPSDVKLKMVAVRMGCI
jgi:hypothetical protein